MYLNIWWGRKNDVEDRESDEPLYICLWLRSEIGMVCENDMKRR